MQERLLHYIWQRRLFLSCPQRTSDGQEVEVIDVGQYNTNAGPDFFNAKIKMGGVVLCGNVEMHIKSSDWHAHRHHLDPAYDSVILHIVLKADTTVRTTQGTLIPQCELAYPKNDELASQIVNMNPILCNQALKEKAVVRVDEWRERLLACRLQKKEELIGQLLMLTQNNWEEAFYITLAHNFGFHTNGEPFELLAKQTPLSFLRKHSDNLMQLEAMLLGQSGLLEKEPEGEEKKILLREYALLKAKFSLVGMEASQWKRLRMRPQNQPAVRIRQFARLLNKCDGLFAKIVETNDLDKLRELFALDEMPLGRSSIDILLINSVVPYQFAYAHARNNAELAEKAMRLLREIPAENNHIVAEWKQLGMRIRSAADSQAFIHLYQNYCLEKRCFGCDIGYQIFTIQNQDK